HPEALSLIKSLIETNTTNTHVKGLMLDNTSDTPLTTEGLKSELSNYVFGVMSISSDSDRALKTLGIIVTEHAEEGRALIRGLLSSQDLESVRIGAKALKFTARYKPSVASELHLEVAQALERILEGQESASDLSETYDYSDAIDALKECYELLEPPIDAAIQVLVKANGPSCIDSQGGMLLRLGKDQPLATVKLILAELKGRPLKDTSQGGNWLTKYLLSEIKVFGKIDGQPQIQAEAIRFSGHSDLQVQEKALELLEVYEETASKYQQQVIACIDRAA
ncbi:unnamed protein product, partial [marine sediment metagenome]